MAKFDSIEASKQSFSAIAFPPIAGIVAVANEYPDQETPVTGESAEVIVPLRIKNYTPPIAKSSIQTVETGYIMSPTDGNVFGGKATSFSVQELPKAVMDGEIDTPIDSETNLPSIQIEADDTPITYGELIALYTEGALQVQSTGIWKRVDPLWFRDPYGRIYENPKILDYTASFVEQVPGRLNFSLTLKV